MTARSGSGTRNIRQYITVVCFFVGARPWGVRVTERLPSDHDRRPHAVLLADDYSAGEVRNCPSWSVSVSYFILQMYLAIFSLSAWWLQRRLVISVCTYQNVDIYYVFIHYPSSCSYLKHCPDYISKQRFGDWILSPSSDKTYSVGPHWHRD
jgi:hypothetical protein